MAEQAAVAKKKQKTSDEYSYVGMVFHRLTRHKLAMAGAVMLILMMLFVFVGPLVWRADPNEQIPGLEGMFNPPSSAHPLGTDDYGRDVLARMFFGGRISLFIGFISAVSATLIGAFIGLLAGYYGGWADNLLMRFTDAMLSIPTFPLLIALASVMGKGMWQIIMVIVVFGWMSDARLVRGLALSLKEQEYVEAARATGASANRIMWRHLFPNTLAVLIVSTTIGSEVPSSMRRPSASSASAFRLHWPAGGTCCRTPSSSSGMLHASLSIRALPFSSLFLGSISSAMGYVMPSIRN